MQKNKLLVFTSHNCTPCHAIIKMLRKENVPFEEIDVNDKKNMQDVIQCKVMSTPTLVKTDKDGNVYHSIVGFRNVRDIKNILNL